MGDMLSSVSTAFGGSGSAGNGALDLAGIGTAGSGIVGNIMNEKQRSDQINQLKSLENPTTLAKDVVAATQPLNSGLVQSVGSQVNANLASQGLSQAPGIQATELSQALAPFEQQNQQTAMQLVLQRLGIPESIIASLPGNSNIAPILAMLMRQNNSGASGNFGGGGGGGMGANDFMNLIWGDPSSSSVMTDSPIDFGDSSAGVDA